MRLRLPIRVLPCAAFLFAAGLLVPVSAAEQAGEANTAVNVPAGAAVTPAPAVPRIDDARSVPGFSPGEIGGLTLPAPAPAEGGALPAPIPAMPQNRVLPANVRNMNNNLSAANAQRTSPDPARARPAYSPDWLIDGVRQLEAEAESRQRRSATGEKTPSGNDDDKARASTSASAPASAAKDNPLADYLEKWVATPEGAAALRAAHAPVQTNSMLADILVERANTEAGIPWHVDAAGAAQAASARASAAVNPYMEDMFQPQMETKGLQSLLPPPPRSMPAPETSHAPMQSPFAPSAPGSAQPATAPVDTSKLIIKPVAPQPTAPVVDEKKYFPQLQRF